MGNIHPGVAGDPNSNCKLCQIGRSCGWTGEGVFHTHDGTTPEILKEDRKSKCYSYVAASGEVVSVVI